MLFAAALAATGRASAKTPLWVSEAAAMAVPQWAASSRAVVLFDLTSITVNPDRTIRTMRQRAIRIMSPSARDLATVGVVLDGRTSLQSFRAWSVAGGQTRALTNGDAVEASPWGALYEDAHIRVLSIPNADPGNTIAWEIEEDEQPFLLQPLWEFQSDLPVLESSLTVAVPDAWKANVRWLRHAAVEPVQISDTIARWRLHDIPAIRMEPRMPAIAAVAGRAIIDILSPWQPRPPAWNEVASWFGRLAEPRCAVSPEIAAKVRELAPPEYAPIDRLRALARFAQINIRYVAVEIGIGGYEPHAAADIFKRRYGDCKDKVTLLRTLLRAAGFDSWYVIVNGSGGFVDPDSPSLGAFDHVIIAIRVPAPTTGMFATIEHPRLGRLLLFDPTSDVTAFGLLPEYEQGSHGLLVADDGGELIPLPVAPAIANQLRRSAKLQLAVGSVSGIVEEIRTGVIAARLRQALRPLSAVERTRFVDRMVSEALVDPHVTNLQIENVDDPDADLVIRYSLQVDRYITSANNLIFLRPRLFGGTSSPIDLDGRTRDYLTDGPLIETDDVEIATGPLSVQELPPPTRIDTPAVVYASKSVNEGGVLRYHSELTIRVATVPLQSIPELNRAFGSIAADARNTVVLAAR
jgi:hypothetical protein